MSDDYVTTLLRALVRDMPRYECNDFDHRKPDQHGNKAICGPYTRFHSAHQQAVHYLRAIDSRNLPEADRELDAVVDEFRYQ